MARTFQFDVDNGGTDPFGFHRREWNVGGANGFAVPIAAPAMFAIAAVGILAAVSFTAGLAAGYSLARMQPIEGVATYH